MIYKELHILNVHIDESGHVRTPTMQSSKSRIKVTDISNTFSSCLASFFFFFFGYNVSQEIYSQWILKWMTHVQQISRTYLAKLKVCIIAFSHGFMDLYWFCQARFSLWFSFSCSRLEFPAMRCSPLSDCSSNWTKFFMGLNSKLQDHMENSNHTFPGRLFEDNCHLFEDNSSGVPQGYACNSNRGYAEEDPLHPGIFLWTSSHSSMSLLNTGMDLSQLIQCLQASEECSPAQPDCQALHVSS